MNYSRCGLKKYFLKWTVIRSNIWLDVSGLEGYEIFKAYLVCSESHHIDGAIEKSTFTIVIVYLAWVIYIHVLYSQSANHNWLASWYELNLQKCIPKAANCHFLFIYTLKDMFVWWLALCTDWPFQQVYYTLFI